MNYAIVDIGSNSLRLLVASAEKGAITPLERKRSIVKLADGIGVDGTLSEQKLRVALDVLGCYSKIAQHYGAKLYAFATSAVRDAKNGRLLAERALSEYGVAVDILSGQSEAQVTLLGAAGVSATGVLIDIGGGSTELISALGGNVSAAISVPRGCVRALKQFDEGASMSCVEDWLLSCPADSSGVSFGQRLSQVCRGANELLITGGSCSISAAYALGERGAYHDQSAGKALSADALISACEQLFAMTQAQRAAITLLSERADTIAWGAAMLAACLKASSVNMAVVATGDNLEGYLRMITYKNA